jgi:hypothetical protein
MVRNFLELISIREDNLKKTGDNILLTKKEAQSIANALEDGYQAEGARDKPRPKKRVLDKIRLLADKLWSLVEHDN